MDVERNLRAPIAGIAQPRDGARRRFHAPAVAVRTGDTPAVERARFQREPADILITTPESLYLLLTSNAREALRRSTRDRRRDPRAGADQARRAPGAVAGAAGGADGVAAAAHRPVGHAASARRSRALPGRGRWTRITIQPRITRITRIGAARKRAGSPDPGDAIHDESTDPAIHDEFSAGACTPRYRDVTIVDTSQKKKLELTIEVPVEDMARMGELEEIPSGPASQGAGRDRRSGARSIRGCWNSSGRTARRSSSSTAAASPSGWRRRSTSWPASRSSARITDRSRGRSGSRSKTS